MSLFEIPLGKQVEKSWPLNEHGRTIFFVLLVLIASAVQRTHLTKKKNDNKVTEDGNIRGELQPIVFSGTQ